jgi:hypothetical protein
MSSLRRDGGSKKERVSESRAADGKWVFSDHHLP